MENIDIKLEQAAQFEEDKKYLHAVQIYLPLLEIEDYSRIAVLKLSELYEKLNNPTKAIELLQKYASIHKNDVAIIKHLSHLLLQNKKYDAVFDILEDISFDENPEVYFLSAYSHYHKNDFKIAAKHFRSFIEFNRSSELLADAYLFMAKSYLNLGLLDEAEFAAQKSEELYQGNADLLLVQAIIYYNKEMYLHSFEKIRKAISINEAESKYYKWAGKILFKLEEYKKAENYLNEYILNYQPDVELLSLLGQAYLGLDDKQKAQIYFDQALKIEPSCPDALEGKKMCK